MLSVLLWACKTGGVVITGTDTDMSGMETADPFDTGFPAGEQPCSIEGTWELIEVYCPADPYSDVLDWYATLTVNDRCVAIYDDGCAQEYWTVEPDRLVKHTKGCVGAPGEYLGLMGIGDDGILQASAWLTEDDRSSCVVPLSTTRWAPLP